METFCNCTDTQTITQELTYMWHRIEQKVERKAPYKQTRQKLLANSGRFAIYHHLIRFLFHFWRYMHELSAQRSYSEGEAET